VAALFFGLDCRACILVDIGETALKSEEARLAETALGRAVKERLGSATSARSHDFGLVHRRGHMSQFALKVCQGAGTAALHLLTESVH
jgi:hypothetical protein